ncbi:MAG: selenium-dependent molybdenum cofactor biosynthesis protein YqeB, partial [Anaerolineae bacterium]|nr:selenium-dependent molybdenum cofactor biosynthesis protein YqeB [Thermoflexales bacterium]MDW8408268.1 selenium-dependent molybdenum cofactor biosynthesis protein YqeB [Anaerolineae bacterium]
GAAYRLHKAGFRVLCIDLPKPLVIRRTVAFASALYDGRITVEGVQAERVLFADEVLYVWQRGCVPVMADPSLRMLDIFRPEVLVDAVMAKRNTGTTIQDAPVVIACGPGFTVGEDCHAVIETQRGHDLGRVLWSGSATPNTGVPGTVGGEDERRVVRAPCDGVFYGRRAIGDLVKSGEVIATVGATPVPATLSGALRGLLHDDVPVTTGLKVADIDPRSEMRYCFTISDKALAIGGGVLEAVFTLRDKWSN